MNNDKTILFGLLIGVGAALVPSLPDAVAMYYDRPELRPALFAAYLTLLGLLFYVVTEAVQ